jgi:hypothetical protein
MEVVGGIYSPNHYSSHCCRWCIGQGTAHCPLPAMSVDRWGLERLTVEVLCLLAAPDSPMRSDFATLTSEFCTVRFHCSHSRSLSAGERCSVGSPNMSGALRTVR